MAKQKKKSAAPVIVAIVLTAVIVVFGLALVHQCDDCGKIFVGTGYKPNVVVDVVTDGQEIICKDCAEKQHVVSGIFGGELSDFSYGLFEKLF